MAAVQPLPDQPDFARLSILLAEVATQVARIPNAAPGPNVITAEDLHARSTDFYISESELRLDY